MWRRLRRSLRWRLTLTGGLAIVAALLLAAFGLNLLFDRHVERVAVAGLEARARAVTAMVDPRAPPGARFREAPADPLFDQPFSGHYWQIELGQDLRRARSLWDYVLPPGPAGAVPGQSRVLTLPGPRGEALLAVEQVLLLEGTPLRNVVATDRHDLDLARRGFLADLAPYLALLGGLLLLGSGAQISVGLRPLAQVSALVAALRAGRRPRIGADLPSEVLPLASEIDLLLDQRDTQLARARHRAADLAHGFKTPLQALLGDADLLRRRGEDDLADSVEAVAVAMRRLVDRELTRARLNTGQSSAQAAPAPLMARVAAVLRRTPKGAALDWQITADPGLRARIDPDDLTEALGALMENAMRHAIRRVDLRLVAQAGGLDLVIRDDGPGVAAADLDRLTTRGLRLDQGGDGQGGDGPGSDGQGIGLALVADIIEAAGGRLTLRNADPGFEVTLHLAAAAS